MALLSWELMIWVPWYEITPDTLDTGTAALQATKYTLCGVTMVEAG